MDWNWLATAGAFAVGFLLPTISARLKPKRNDPLRPVCSCGHGFGTHADGKGCNHAKQVASHWDALNRADRWTAHPCSCLRYDGPDPVIFGLDMR